MQPHTNNSSGCTGVLPYNINSDSNLSAKTA